MKNGAKFKGVLPKEKGNRIEKDLKIYP